MPHPLAGSSSSRFALVLALLCAWLALGRASSAEGCCPFDCPQCVCFWRLTVPDLASPSWKSCIPLGCDIACADPGWPKVGILPSDSETDAGVLADRNPLLLYDVNDVGNALRVVKSGAGDVTVSF